MATSGNVYGVTDSHVYLKKHGVLTPFVWGGRCMRLEDGTEALGGVNVTTRQNPRGGLERDGVRAEGPGATTTGLAMKRIQRDTMKTELRRCFYDVDKRVHCSGIDRDSPYKWEEITRFCQAKMTDRRTSGTAWEGTDEDMVTFSVTALSVDDIYRVSGSLGEPAHDDLSLNITVLDVDVCQPERCPDFCDEQEECVVVAVTEDDASNSYLLVNLYAGDLDRWTAQTLTAFGANDADAVVGIGEFVVAVSTGDTSIIYSDDLGVTQVNIDQATYADWGAHPPTQIDAIDQTFIVMCGEDGYVYGSFDAARSWETLSDGTATDQDLSRIMIARDNPQVIYAIGYTASNAVIKSENGGESFFPLTAPAGGVLSSLDVIDQSTVLIGTDAGEVFQSVDSGGTFVEQGDLPGLSTKANYEIEDICHSGCGVLYLVANDDSGNHQQIFRNVDGGASGRWYEPADYEDPGTANRMLAVTCCGPNHALVVGGQAGATDAMLLLK